MAHPRMYQDDDPYLADVRKVFLDFPEAVEVEAWGRPTFRAGKKIFGVFSGTDERPYSPPYFGPSGWLALDLEGGPVDWYEVRELADASYRQVALKRMLRALDA